MAPIFNLQRLLLASAAFAIMVMASSAALASANNPVPEPASLFLMGSGLVAVATVMRRRLKNRKTESQE